MSLLVFLTRSRLPRGHTRPDSGPAADVTPRGGRPSEGCELLGAWLENYAARRRLLHYTLLDRRFPKDIGLTPGDIATEWHAPFWTALLRPRLAEGAPFLSVDAATAARHGAASLLPRTRLLLAAPILPMLLRLSAPNLVEAAARITFLTADALFVSWLGSDALAAVSIVFPLLLLVQTATASGFGAGVSSSIGQALGAGDRETAFRLAGTALALILIAAIATTTSLLLFGPALYRAMGANGRTLELTTRYGAVIFGGIGLVWVMNILANIARGSGNMAVPASAIFLGETCHVLLSPALILGWGGLPRLGVTGAALGALSAYGVGTAVIGGYLYSRHAIVRITARRIRINTRAARAILKIGMPAAASVLVFWSVNLFILALIGRFGNLTIAAYGAATRLDTIQYPIIFAFGSSVVTMVATAVGAGDRRRAARVARTGCAVAAVIASVFTIVGLSGDAWMRLFTADPAIRATGALYLRTQAPVFPIFAAGIAATMACYGIGAVSLPLVVNLARFVFAIGGGGLALALSRQTEPVFIALAVAAGIHGIVMVLFLHRRLLARAQSRSGQVEDTASAQSGRISLAALRRRPARPDGIAE